jgi:predicted nucleic acid-binding protein
MDNCKKAYVSSRLQETILNKILQRKSLEELIPWYQEVWSIPSPPVEPCLSCASCYDYIFYSNLLRKIGKQNKIDLKALEVELHTWKKTQLQDDVLTSLKQSNGSNFSYEKYSPKRKVVYFDQNMLSDYDDNVLVYQEINRVKEKLDICYSPSHLEEINKTSTNDDVKRLLGKLTELTENLVVLPDKNGHFYAKEKPEYGLDRVKSYPGSTDAVENLKLLSSKERSLFLERYDKECHKKVIGNNENIYESLSDEDFNELLFYTHSSFRSKPSIKEYDGRDGFLHAVYTLFGMLDLLSYRVDNQERTIKSSAHDIEHIIYASEADYFVTKDKKLYHRAKQIYKFLDIKTMVLNHRDYLEQLELVT